MYEANDWLRLQREQYAHDQRNHADILHLSKNDRLKHYGLHFAKYVGRLARGTTESKSVERTVIDTFLVCLSAANTLHQELNKLPVCQLSHQPTNDPVYVLADAAGRFADACEKIDHLEEFLPIAKQANADVIRWVVSIAAERSIDIEPALKSRRKELAARQFYIAE
ncbi:MAG TPA: hypothetical protein VNJ49_01700 [Bradyrhizobium sp.]|nr:hypothetical protein [Bradyrhizobium sp.]